MAQIELSTTELSQLTGVPYRTVAQWCATGRIGAEKDSAGEYRIPASEVERVRSELCDRALRSLQRLVGSA